MLTRSVALAAVVGLAAAASSTDACSQATATVASQADATALADCDTLDGSLYINPAISGTLDLSGIGQITGDFNVTNATLLTSLTSTTLNSIGGAFILEEVQILSTLTMDSLSSVGSIHWQTLPALQEFSFGSNTLASSGDVVITDTFLSDLSPLGLETVSDLNVNNNKHLTSISVPLANATGAITFSANGNGQNFELEFPNLKWAVDITLSNCSTISMPSLEKVNGTLGFYSNYVTSIEAANLTATGDDLTFAANSKLDNITMNALTSVGGGFVIANNSALMKIDGFAKVSQIGGALDFSGNFTEVDLPALKDVKGGFNMESSGNFSCDAFDEDKSNSYIQGTYTCSSSSTDVQSGTGSNSGSSTGTASGSSPTKSGEAGMIRANLPYAVGLAAVAGGIMHFEL